MDDITLSQIEDVIVLLKKNAVSPRIVKDQEEADYFTGIDPCGKIWVVGEEYYLMREYMKPDMVVG